MENKYRVGGALNTSFGKPGDFVVDDVVMYKENPINEWIVDEVRGSKVVIRNLRSDKETRIVESSELELFPY